MVVADDSRRRAGYLEGVVSIIVNTALFAAKFYVALLHNSAALLADSVHTLSDSLTSVVVIVGFWISYRPADREHPLGHGRAEAVATVVIGTLLASVAAELFQASIGKILSRESLLFSWYIIAVLATSAITKEAMARWSMWLGRRYEAQPLVADAWHHRADATASTLLAISIALGREVWWVDGVLGLVVSSFILYTSIRLVAGGSRELLGTGPTEKEVETLKKLAYSSSDKVADVHHIHVHRYGTHTEVTLHIRLDGKTTLEEAHEISSNVERRIKEELGWEATVHPEPVRRGEIRERGQEPGEVGSQPSTG